MYCYHFVTNPGLEDIVEDELRRVLPASATFEQAPMGRTGVTAVHTPHPISRATFLSIRSIYHAIEIFLRIEIAELPDLEGENAVARIASAAERTAIPHIDETTPIAVRCRRRGEHRFQSPQVERAVGTVLVNRYRCPVNLVDPVVTVRVEIIDGIVDIGTLATPPEMDRRFAWVYRPRVTLSTVTARALLYLARRGYSGPNGAILDPFCGSGTIPIESVGGRSKHDPSSPAFASDINPEAVAGTRANLAANSVASGVVVRCLDATDPQRLRAAWGARGVTTIVCNPPYGVRLGRSLDFDTFYDNFLTGASGVLSPGGRIVMMSSRHRGALNGVIARMPVWRIVHVRIIETGGVFPGIFVLERR